MSAELVDYAVSFTLGGGDIVLISNTISPIKLLPDDFKIENQGRRKQGWDSVVPAWTFANIQAPATTFYSNIGAGLYVSASSWQDAPTGPPSRISQSKIKLANVKFLWREKNLEQMQKAAGWLSLTGDDLVDARNKTAIQEIAKQYQYSLEMFYEQADTVKSKMPAAMRWAALNGGPFICAALKQVGKRQLEALETLQTCASKLGANFIIADQPHINKSSLEFWIANKRHENEKISKASRAAQADIKSQLDQSGFYITKKGDRIERLGTSDSTVQVAAMSKARIKQSYLDYESCKDALRSLVNSGLSLRAIGYELGFSHQTAAKYKKRLLNGE